MAALAAGTEAALSDRGAAVREIAAKSGADERAGAGAARGRGAGAAAAAGARLAQLRRWARFDERFGILRRAPDVERAFAP